MPSKEPTQGLPPLPPPEVIGPYRLFRHIGHGGSAEVYAAQDLHAGHWVALKLQHRPGQARETARFYREYQVLGGFRHPNLPRVFALGELPDGRLYLTMELLSESEPLRDSFKHQLPPHANWVREVAAIGAQVAQALGALHQCGVMHGDVKPSNIRICREKLWLLDLGGARDLEAPQPWIPSRHFFGTYTYAAPEQLVGSAVDARADLYSLGVVLHGLFTGERLFHAKNRKDATAERAQSPPKPPEGIPQALGDLVAGLLACDPSMRPSVQDAESILRAHAGGLPLDSSHLCENVLEALQINAATAPPSIGDPAHEAAARLLAQGDLEQAEASFAALTDGGFWGLSEVWRLSGRFSEARALLWRALPQESPQGRLGVALAEIDLDLDRLALAERWLRGVDAGVLARDPTLLVRALVVRARLMLAFGAASDDGALMDGVLWAKQRSDWGGAARLLAWCSVLRANAGKPQEARAMAEEAVAALIKLGNLPWLAEASVCRVLVLNALGTRAPLPEAASAWLSQCPAATLKLAYYLAVAARDPDSPAYGLAYQQLRALWQDLCRDAQWALKLIPWVAKFEATLHTSAPKEVLDASGQGLAAKDEAQRVKEGLPGRG